MADPRNGASGGTFAASVARLNDKEHEFGKTAKHPALRAIQGYDSRATLRRLQDKQLPGFSPNSPDAFSLMKKRNAGRKLSSIPEMQAVHRKHTGKTLIKPPPAYAYSGMGAAFVDPTKDWTPYGGEPQVINHEFEHAYAQPAGTHHSAAEIAPVLGDIVFGAEAFRRQAGKDLKGKIPYGFKNQEAGWMRQQASKHGYFDGKSMTELLRTPEGLSYLRQAALGPQSSANVNKFSAVFDPLAPDRPDLPFPDKPINLPAFPDYAAADPNNSGLMQPHSELEKRRQRVKNNRALRSVFPPPPPPAPMPAPRNNNTVPLSMQATIGNPLSGDLNKARELERLRIGMLDASSPFYSDDTTEASNALEAHERIRYPGYKDAIVPRQNGNIRSLLGKYEDNPMGGYSTPIQSILFPFYKRNQGILDNMKARYGN